MKWSFWQTPSNNPTLISNLLIWTRRVRCCPHMQGCLVSFPNERASRDSNTCSHPYGGCNSLTNSINYAFVAVQSQAAQALKNLPNGVVLCDTAHDHNIINLLISIYYCLYLIPPSLTQIKKNDYLPSSHFSTTLPS